MGEPKELALRYPQSCPFCSIAAAYRFADGGAATAAKELRQQQQQQQQRRGHDESAASESVTAISSSSSTSASSPSSSLSSSHPHHGSGPDLSTAAEAEAEAPNPTTALRNSLLLASIPSLPSAVDPAKVSPAAYVVLAAPRVLAFLDIMPMTRGHLLVTTRRHRGKVEELVGGGGGGGGGSCSGNGEEGQTKQDGDGNWDGEEEEEGDEGRDIGFWLPLLAKTVATVTGVHDYNIVQNNGARAAQVVPHVHFHIIPRPHSLPALQNKSWTMFGRGQREELDDDEAAALAAAMRAALRGEVEALVARRGRRGRRVKL